MKRSLFLVVILISLSLFAYDRSHIPSLDQGDQGASSGPHEYNMNYQTGSFTYAESSYLTIGNTPLLTTLSARESGKIQESLYVPSILAELKRGEFYIGQLYKGVDGIGIVVPSESKKLVGHLFFNLGNQAQRDPQTVLQDMGRITMTGVDVFGTGGDGNNDGVNGNNRDFIPTLKLFAGGGVGYDMDGIYLGANLKYYRNSNIASSYAPASDETVEVANLAQRIDITPSVSTNLAGGKIDGGINFVYQWINNSIDADYTYPYTYDGNMEVSLFSRYMMNISDWTTLSASMSLGYLPASSDLKVAGNDNFKGSVDLSEFTFATRIGAVLKPIESLTSATSFHMSYVGQDISAKEDDSVVVANSSAEDSETLFMFHQTLKYNLVDWFALKGGATKMFFTKTISGKRTSVTDAGTTTNYDNSNTFNGEGIGKYVGFELNYLNFNFETLLNVDFITNGPEFLSGGELGKNNDLGFVSNLSYRW